MPICKVKGFFTTGQEFELLNSIVVDRRVYLTLDLVTLTGGQ